MMRIMNMSRLNEIDNQSLDGSGSESYPSETPQPSLEGVNPADVLSGRDRPTVSHPGNKYFRKIVAANREEYQTAPSRDAKTRITSRLLDMVRKMGGRFLKIEEETGVWVELDEAAAREKVSHALRSAKDPNRIKQKKPRQVKKHVFSEEEDELFKNTLADQQRIFKELLAREARSGMHQFDFDKIEIFIS
eukprot:Nitzschia sp. Nitz4//scaffold82_size85912//78903//79475//NITZ4_005154-RA/size85912-processed-gene-0.105-mRNA-1//1//CDS//3329558874//4306//frame0